VTTDQWFTETLNRLKYTRHYSKTVIKLNDETIDYLGETKSFQMLSLRRNPYSHVVSPQ